MSGPIKRIGPAAGGAAVEADIDVGEQRVDIITRPSPPADLVDAKFQWSVSRLYAYGPRVTAEFLARLGAMRMCRSEIEALLREYRDRFDPDLARQVGADRIVPLPPLRLVTCAP